MKIVHFGVSSPRFNAAKTTASHEYAIFDPDIDCAFIKVAGQYPGDDKFVINTGVKEVIFVVEGAGVIDLKGPDGYVATRKFEKFDVIFIDVGDIYRIDAHANLCVSCAPPWSPEQQKIVG